MARARFRNRLSVLPAKHSEAKGVCMVETVWKRDGRTKGHLELGIGLGSAHGKTRQRQQFRASNQRKTEKVENPKGEVKATHR
jgi:hypothetical protein